LQWTGKPCTSDLSAANLSLTVYTIGIVHYNRQDNDHGEQDVENEGRRGVIKEQ